MSCSCGIHGDLDPVVHVDPSAQVQNSVTTTRSTQHTGGAYGPAGYVPGGIIGGFHGRGHQGQHRPRDGNTEVVVERPGLTVTVNTDNRSRSHRHRVGHQCSHHLSHSAMMHRGGAYPINIIAEVVKRVLEGDRGRMMDGEMLVQSALQELMAHDQYGTYFGDDHLWTDDERVVFRNAYARRYSDMHGYRDFDDEIFDRSYSCRHGMNPYHLHRRGGAF